MKRWARWAAVFFIGMLAGASITNLIIGAQIDYLHMNNESLRQQLSASERELQSLKDSLAEKNQQVVTGIETKIKFTGEKLTEYEKSSAQLAVEKQVEDWLNIIEGQEIKKLDYMLIPEIIDNREIKVDGRKLQLKVKMVVITETVVVHVEVTPVPQDSEQ